MREILFRGKRIDNGEWAYGNFVMDATEQVQRENIPLEPILADGFIRRYDLAQLKIVMHEVGRETIGQYTGLTDKYGKRIFEGDIIKQSFSLNGRDRDVFSVIEYGVGYANLNACGILQRFRDGSGKSFLSVFDERGIVLCEVIGNIHDNPELVEGGAEQ